MEKVSGNKKTEIWMQYDRLQVNVARQALLTRHTFTVDPVPTYVVGAPQL